MQPTAGWMQRAAENAAPRSVSFRRMPTVTLTRNQRALAWALGIMALLAAVAVTRHHLEMMDHSPGGHYLTWGHAISQQAPDYILWALTIPLVYLFVDRVARRRWVWPRTVLAHAAFALVVALAVILLRNGWYGAKDFGTITRVSDLLRDGLVEDDRAEVTLEEEVALARRYLAVEEVRFADGLDVRVELTEQAKAARVPRLILQPLVENAVRHGIGARAAAGRIGIRARVSGRELIVEVSDDGHGPAVLTPRPPLLSGEGGTQVSNGVGLRNTRARLEAAYGSAARFTLEQAPEGGAIATLVIPLRFDVGAQHAAPLPTS